MRAALTATAIVVTLIGGLAGAAAAGEPGPSQIRRAVARAEASSSLWATVNLCSAAPGGHGGLLGVRAQMPSLGFPATLRMTVRLGYWSTRHERFVSVRGSRAASSVWLGSRSTGTHQGGVEFRFTSPAGLLNASVRFTWSRHGRIVGEAWGITTRGHPDADFSRPAHYSADVCRLG